MRKGVVILALVVAMIAFCCVFPRYTEELDEFRLHSEYTVKRHNDDTQLFPIMTFNIRYDGEESDPNNHYTKRVDRIVHTILKWNPYIVGLQEPFAGQLLHLQSKLPKYFREIGFLRNTGDLGHPSRHNDMQIAMLYDDNKLELLEQDYLWLSKTPRKENSKSWNSHGIRTLNIAHFKLRGYTQEIIAFNTHLDAFEEEARREQSKLVLSTIKEWQKKYPAAVIFLTGDFNTCPGQAAYNTLTSHLNDTWVDCELPHCYKRWFSSTFHGWLGSILNTYAGRALQTVVFSFHGMGLVFPHYAPKHFSEIFAYLKPPKYSVFDGIPLWPFNRFHVDWILYKDAELNSTNMQPSLVGVADVRDTNFSSDHFPVIGLFKFSKLKHEY